MNQDKNIDRLRQTAQRQANEYQEKVLLIIDPPAMPIHGFKSAIPYCVLVTHASSEEKGAYDECFVPEKKDATNTEAG